MRTPARRGVRRAWGLTQSAAVRLSDRLELSTRGLESRNDGVEALLIDLVVLVIVTNDVTEMASPDVAEHHEFAVSDVLEDLQLLRVGGAGDHELQLVDVGAYCLLSDAELRHGFLLD